ncbi:hypothetical protein B566_EDAN007996, partial [Ephemera danica]
MFSKPYMAPRQLQLDGVPALSDSEFETFLSQDWANSKSCSEVFEAFRTVTKHIATNDLEIWNALDKTCVDNIKNWNFTQLWQMCDHWFLLNLGGICSFNWNAINKVSRKTAKLTPQQL